MISGLIILAKKINAGVSHEFLGARIRVFAGPPEWWHSNSPISRVIRASGVKQPPSNALAMRVCA